jgi:biopolymer transport protein ExbB
VSAWIKTAAVQDNAVLFQQVDGAKSIRLGIASGKLYAAADAKETPRTTDVTPGAWHHVALTAGSALTVYLDGKEVAQVPITLADMQGEVVLGKGFTGEMDEFELAGVARSADWIKIAADGQGSDALLVGYGQDEANGGGGTSYFGTILHSVTLDGWVVIGILFVMAIISWVVMALKALVINKVRAGNKAFLHDYNNLSVTDTSKLDQEESEEDAEIQGSQMLIALYGKHDHYQDSTLYRIYHTGMQEIKHRFGKADVKDQYLSPQAIGSIKASLDATLVRETQKLSSLMVLLTIAISGGPFLGLLGTVVGVMITFAAIAATGDVNVAAIAPGIAAALVATVAGLAVAIPALFGYNYLGSVIKNTSADMHIFVDEYISRITEAYSR